MAQTAFAMYKLASQGYCCSQIMVLMDLRKKDIENPILVRAMTGLCGGIGGSGNTCGVLTGGACLLGIYAGKGNPDEPRDENLNKMIKEYVNWFNSENHSLDCEDIVGEKGMDDAGGNAYPVKCGNLMSKAYKKIKEILKEYGYIGGNGC